MACECGRERDALPLPLERMGRGRGVRASRSSILGPKVLGAISKTLTRSTNFGYLDHDAQGNMVADVSKYGSSFQVNDKRSFDAWGNIRQGAQTGDPKGRYCANLGHKQDDESGLPDSTSFASLSEAGIYMRARYYEPTSGRFLSEDCQYQDGNLFVYCSSNPISKIDPTGNLHTNGDFLTNCYDFFYGLGIVSMGAAAIFGGLKMKALCLWAVETSAKSFVIALGATDMPTVSTVKIDMLEFFTVGAGLGLMTAIASGLSPETLGSVESVAVVAIAAYSAMLAAGLLWCYEGED